MQRDQTGSANSQLRRERQQRGWSQAELALRVGSGAKSVARWEAKRAYPTPYYRQKLCELFGKTADELGLLTDDYLSDSPAGLAQPSAAAALPSLHAAPAPVSASDLIRHYRSQAGLSQQELATRLHLSKHALGSLERGLRSPSPSFLEALARELSLAQPEREQLLAYTTPGVSAKIDWGEAPFLEHFYGREKELLELEQWINDDHCRLVALLGFGGRGKTALAAKLVERLKERFSSIFWRSLQNALPLETLLRSCLHFLADGQSIDLPESIEDQITLLIQYLRERRCLLILDNVETILQAGGRAGHYRAEYEDYGRLLRRVGETHHESCLLLTSREKPKELARLEGALSPVRVLQLPGLGEAESRSLMRDRRLWGSDEDWAKLIYIYSGNPLALQLVSESIREIFGGDIAAFLRREKIVFGDIQDLIAQQFQRLSPLEQEVMYWLAIEREPISLDVLQEDILRSPLKDDALVALGSLRRRSMVEVKDLMLFTLQPVIMEYVTDI
ncbi:MAG TPA: helix-turn-helix domain-containing protein, partial [Ktedonobacteraceae bacterium]|nr:helix-turn-helix domain-containing protein [Ktedonobacteraceae bacterium]